MWKLRHYSFFTENDYSAVIPFTFTSDKIILEIYQLEKDKIDWIGWVSKVSQSDIIAIEPPIKIYVNQKRLLKLDNYFPYQFEIKSNNYNIENIHIKIYEWVPLEFINSQVIQGTEDFQEIMPARTHRTNWYLENQSNNSLTFKWGTDGNEWDLKPGKFISGELGKNSELFARGNSSLEFIETWEE